MELNRKVIIIMPTKKLLITHHIDENVQNNSLENLITLCRICHPKIHYKQILVKPIEQKEEEINGL